MPKPSLNSADAEHAESGFLLCDKPAGMTSHDVVARVRRERGLKVGHAGTLDPFATGLLVVLLGRATRLQRYVLGLPKTYLATARLGWRSTTGDPDGELTETGVIPATLELPTGPIAQRVPMTSAVKVDGERLYKKARRGEEAERPVRDVTIHRAELLTSDDERARFEIECSTGTYVRTLIEELSDAYCEELRRTAIGHLLLEDATEELLPVEELLSFLPERVLEKEQAKHVSHGIPLASAGEGEGPIRLTSSGKVIAVARRHGDWLKPDVVLA